MESSGAADATFFFQHRSGPSDAAAFCASHPPAADIEPLREGTPAKYEALRSHAAAWVKNGGLVRVHCTGGDGGVALVWTRKDNARGYDLITIYDD